MTMSGYSFNSHLEAVRKDPTANEEINKEIQRLDAAVALMEAREQVGMTQEQLAKEAHVSRITIARIERGRISPSFRTLSALAGAMGKRLKVEII